MANVMEGKLPISKNNIDLMSSFWSLHICTVHLSDFQHFCKRMSNKRIFYIYFGQFIFRKNKYVVGSQSKST